MNHQAHEGDAAPQASLLEKLLGIGVKGIEPLKGGGNNRVYRVKLENASEVCVKTYLTVADDSRDRLGVEYSALSLLWELGERCVPQPLAIDREAQLAVYSFIRGNAWDKISVHPNDLAQVTAFIERLKKYANDSRAAALQAASEAYFTFGDITASLEKRRAMLTSALRHSNPASAEYLAFMEHEFSPASEALENWLSNRNARQAWPKSGLSQAQKTLSPSDLGFHNAICQQSGTWAFLDFEYFGVDDPAKLLVDFMLHPAMKLSTEACREFYQKTLPIFNDSELPARTKVFAAIAAYKWAMIVLNEFVPTFQARRQYAKRLSPDELRNRQLAQLGKSRDFLQLATSIQSHGLEALFRP